MHTGTDTSTSTTFGGRIMGTRGAVASQHYLSCQAGMEILRAGGNAFDAAAAAVFVESVVNPHMFTLGGEAPMVLYSANEDRVLTVNGNTQAPASATLDAYRERCAAFPDQAIPPRGILAAGVPAAPAALLDMLTHYGSLPLEQLVEPALDLCRAGFPLHEGILGLPRFSLNVHRDWLLAACPGTTSLYFQDNDVPPVGMVVRNTAHGDVLEALGRAASGAATVQSGYQAARDLFYKGDLAKVACDYSRSQDGFLDEADLAAYDTRFEAPLTIDFRGARVFKCGTWCQGPAMLMMLRILDGFDLNGMGHNSADYLHLWTEAAKLAFADREHWCADPAFFNAPVDALISAEYGNLRRELVDMARASRELRPGDPRRMAALLPEDERFVMESWGYGTVHVAAGDKHGNLIAITPSGGWLCGNDTVPGLGFPLGCRLQTFYLDERHPNVIAPNKRPRTTLTPSMAFFSGSEQGGAPWRMAFGTMGGDQQDQWLTQFLLNRVVFGMTVQQAIEAPKVASDHFPGTFHPHAASPARLRAENRIPAEVLSELETRGHEIVDPGGWRMGYICAVERTTDGVLESGADPRGNKTPAFPSQALAW